jgi:hypothetical protein
MGIVPNPNESVEQIAIDQRAVDPRLENQEVVAPETPETPVEAVEGEEHQEVPVQKPRKTAEEVLKGRVGHLTKTLSSKDQELVDARNRLAAAEALLASRTNEDGTPVTPPAPATTPHSYSPEEFEAAVEARAQADAFNQKADDMYNEGSGKFNDWKDTVDTLVASGFMNKDLLDAAMAVGNGAEVLHHLGSNLDEAERINALTPIHKAAALAKISSTLTVPRTTPISSAPAPIQPVHGSPSPTIDLQRVADTDDMSAYIAARAKQGSRWATR